MKIKVSTAQGPTLDWLVAKCEGVGVELMGRACAIEDGVIRQLHYSTNWAQGGPIIDQEGISVIRLEHEYGVDAEGYTTSERSPVFGAVIGEYFDTDMQRNSYGESYGEIYYIGAELVVTGPTLLIAAMRCYVSSRLGEEVEVPDGLI